MKWYKHMSNRDEYYAVPDTYSVESKENSQYRYLSENSGVWGYSSNRDFDDTQWHAKASRLEMTLLMGTTGPDA